MGIDGYGWACLEVLLIPFGAIFAVGVLVAGALGRPLRHVAALAAIAMTMNAGMLCVFWRESAWSWQQVVPLGGIWATGIGFLFAVI